MRGKGATGQNTMNNTGITPAHAGKRTTFVRLSQSSKDHPRACGEKSVALVCTTWLTGSPPRMRGKGIVPCIQRLFGGITPAHAGKSFAFFFTHGFCRDHPRACGEKFRGYVKIWNEWGSPPRMRGKVNALPFRGYVKRITPAHAGKRNSFTKSFQEHGDHPRACGEKR